MQKTKEKMEFKEKPERQYAGKVFDVEDATPEDKTMDKYNSDDKFNSINSNINNTFNTSNNNSTSDNNCSYEKKNPDLLKQLTIFFK